MLENINSISITDQLLLKSEGVKSSEVINTDLIEKNDIQKDAQEKSNVTSPVRAELSQSVLKQLNSYITSEDVLTKKLNTAQTIYDSLSSLQIELLNLKNKLQETPEENIEELENIDNESNSLIDKVVSVLKKDTYGIVDNNYLSNVFSQLSFIQKLSLDDNDYLLKLNSLGLNVSTQTDVYNKVTEGLYSKLTEIYNKFNQSVEKAPVSEKDSKEIQKKVVESSSETLLASSSALTPEVVLGLLQGYK